MFFLEFLLSKQEHAHSKHGANKEEKEEKEETEEKEEKEEKEGGEGRRRKEEKEGGEGKMTWNYIAQDLNNVILSARNISITYCNLFILDLSC